MEAIIASKARIIVCMVIGNDLATVLSAARNYNMLKGYQWLTLHPQVSRNIFNVAGVYTPSIPEAMHGWIGVSWKFYNYTNILN